VLLKTIGLIGGMSWESTVSYYRQINEAVRDRLGGLHSARIVLYSVDFHDIERLQQSGDWAAAGAMLADAARSLAAAGADFLVLCTNTMHQVAPAIEAAVAIPLLHIADPTAAAIRQAGHSTVGLLGTRFTMEQAFYRQRLSENHGLGVIVPNADDREIIHRIIYDELCLGRVLPQSRLEYRRIIDALAAQGAQAVILGCTEISLLVGQQDAAVPLFDTTAIHARAAAATALAGGALPIIPALAMRIDHLALWTSDLERCKQFYSAYFGAVAGAGYVNSAKGFASCFLSFADGARIEAMTTTVLSPLLVEPGAQRMGLTHFAVALGSESLVDELTRRLKNDGHPILDGPRRTGDGYYESVVLDPDGNRIEICA
jgi:aspartate racemase